MRISFLFIWISLLWGLSSCGKFEETELHHQASLSVRYLSLDRSVRAQVTIWEAADSLKQNALQLAGDVRFQDRTMAFNSENLSKPCYLLEYRTDFPKSMTLETQFADFPSAKLFFEMDPIGDFEVQESNSEAGGITLEIEGGRLSDDESLVVLLTDDQNTVHTFPIPGPSSSNTHRLTANQMNQLQPGAYTLFLVKKQERDDQKEGLQVSSLIEYFSTSQEIKLK